MTTANVSSTAADSERTSTRDLGLDAYEAEQIAPAHMPRLAVVMECRRPSVLGCRVMLDQLEEVIIGRASGEGGLRVVKAARRATIRLGDFEASRQHLVLRRRTLGWEVEDLGSRNGTLINGERVSMQMLSHGDLIEAGGTMMVFLEGGPRWLEPVDRDLLGEAGAEAPGMLHTLSLDMEARLRQSTKIAPSLVPVLVRGETGTGKELMARAIHQASGRAGAFVPVNCGALPRELIESELFGHRRGSFSGATEEREGLIRRAHKGTLFLDEIAELPLDSQAALLRVLQEGEVRPVGASDPIKVDVRLVAATHQDLDKRIAAGVFRQDLYARIAGFELTMPPLRDRREDLGTLIASILARTCPAPDKISLQKSAARAMARYPWPLNIRELVQSLAAAIALGDGCQIRLEHLPAAIRDYEAPRMPVMTPHDRMLRERLIQLLREASGNIAAVGRAMERAPIQIRRWCHRLNIDLRQFRH